MITIGIDNGINGGIVVLEKPLNVGEKFKVIEKMIMPTVGSGRKEYDNYTISNFFKKYKDSNVLVILEKSQPQFRDGSKQAWKTGFGYGIIQGILTALLIPYEIVAPKTWQKKMFEGLKAKDTKIASIQFCQQLFPKEDWRATTRCKNMHDGMTDACCMAMYGHIK